MTLYQFNALDEMEQAQTAWEGTHLGNRSHENFDVLLYQVDSFYVEIFYEREFNTIAKLRSFSSTDQLTPYFSQIDISGIK